MRPGIRGFTLVELMLVVSIIAILSAIAIPVLSSSRAAANEASAISSLRTINRCNEQYRNRFGEYAPSLFDLVSAGYLDSQLGSGQKSGYDFQAYLGGGLMYFCEANPLDPGSSGDRGFFIDETGVIRFVTSGIAGPTDAPLD